jgi:hypothetical protein
MIYLIPIVASILRFFNLSTSTNQTCVFSDILEILEILENRLEKLEELKKNIYIDVKSSKLFHIDNPELRELKRRMSQATINEISIKWLIAFFKSIELIPLIENGVLLIDYDITTNTFTLAIRVITEVKIEIIKVYCHVQQDGDVTQFEINDLKKQLEDIRAQININKSSP